MTNGPDDIHELGYKLDISHFLFNEQELSLYESLNYGTFF